MGLGFILGAPREKKRFLVIIIRYGKLQNMTCGFIYTVTVAKASRLSKNMYADSRQICVTDLG